MPRLLTFWAAFVCAASLRAQDTTTVKLEPIDDSLVAERVTLDPVVVTVTRGVGTSVRNAPFALTIARPDSTRPGQRHSAFDESLAMIPGLTAENRTNPSQDPRISIRGFGARSTFGVRGIRVLRDGMPLTLPDGQTPVDYLSLESVGRIEVIRGAASALYGNASGGVINVMTAAPPPTAFSGEVKQWISDYETYRTTLKAGGASGRMYYQADGTYSTSGGYRLYSRQRSSTGFARAGVTAAGTDYALEMIGSDMPLAENPGALTLAQFRANPRNPDAASVNKHARKVVRQLQVGLSANRELLHDELFASAFIGRRTLYNPLTFAIVDLGRHSYGGSARYSHLTPWQSVSNKLSFGFDAQSQNDSRLNFANCNSSPPPVSPTATCPTVGNEEGVLTLDQRELVSSAGAFFSDELFLMPSLRMSGGVRADNVKFEVRDRLITANNPDDSGRRSLHALTPYLGINARLNEDHSLYGNISSAFETPTATELGNHPDGSAGINQDLKPQRSTTYEVGLKGGAFEKISYDLATFVTKARDELIPFEIPSSGGRRYFRNAGRTTRLGAEVGAGVVAGPLLFNAAYTYSDFRFDRYATSTVVYDGKRIPGIPMNRVQASVTLNSRSGFLVTETEIAGPAFVDDANTLRAPGFEVLHLRAGSDHLFGSPYFSVVAGIQNVFNRAYSPSISINAAAGKFFEPAPLRTFYIGLSLRNASK